MVTLWIICAVLNVMIMGAAIVVIKPDVDFVKLILFLVASITLGPIVTLGLILMLLASD